MKLISSRRGIVAGALVTLAIVVLVRCCLQRRVDELDKSNLRRTASWARRSFMLLKGMSNPFSEKNASDDGI